MNPNPPTPTQQKYNTAYKEHGTMKKAAIAYGVNYSTIRNAVKRCQEYEHLVSQGNSEPASPGEDVKLEETVEGPNRNIVSSSHQIRTLDQLLAYCRVDLKEWEVTKYVENSWGSEKNKNFQVKAWLSKRHAGELTVEELRREFLSAIQDHAPVYRPHPGQDSNRSGNAAEISIHDLHFGSLCWQPETGQDYDIKIAERVYHDAIDHLIAHIKPYNPQQIIFPVGSDFFNVNSKLNTTSAGTYQDEDSRWQKTFIYGRKMVVQAVDRLREIAPVWIPVVPGNHDEERAFYLGDSLFCWYRQCDNVSVDNAPLTRKYWLWGKCLVGFVHGSDEVRGTLPMIMATEQPELWARSKYREWHTGHLHHKATKSYDYAVESNGVRERILPSLAATDAWHKKKGYGGLRAAEAFIWNKDGGNIGTFSYQPPDTIVG